MSNPSNFLGYRDPKKWVAKIALLALAQRAFLLLFVYPIPQIGILNDIYKHTVPDPSGPKILRMPFLHTKTAFLIIW